MHIDLNTLTQKKLYIYIYIYIYIPTDQPFQQDMCSVHDASGLVHTSGEHSVELRISVNL